MPSLLDAETAQAAALVRRRSLRTRLNEAGDRAGARVAAIWSRPAPRRTIMAVSSVGAVAVGLGIYLAVRPVPKPDYESAEIARLFDYTLLTDEFNKLPVEERVRLIGQLVQRVRDMDASESAMMAAFFAGVAGEAREQLEENASKLMLDAADMVAKDYAAVPPEQRADYMDEAIVRLVRLGEALDPGLAERTDEEILDQARRDAQRDEDALERGEISSNQASRMMIFMESRVQRNASSHQRQRVNLFMRDMIRHLRDGGG